MLFSFHFFISLVAPSRNGILPAAIIRDNPQTASNVFVVWKTYPKSIPENDEAICPVIAAIDTARPAPVAPNVSPTRMMSTGMVKAMLRP